MKKLSFMIILIGLFIGRSALAEPSQAQIEMLNKVMAEHEEAESEKSKELENPWLAVVEPLMGAPSEPRVGMSVSEFAKGRGMPDKKEIKDGADVFWYDGEEPYYAVFKNKKLVSFYIDKETINFRANERRRQQEAIEQAQHEEQIKDQERKREAIKYFRQRYKPQQAYQIQTTKPIQTNCNQIGNQLHCTSY